MSNKRDLFKNLEDVDTDTDETDSEEEEESKFQNKFTKTKKKEWFGKSGNEEEDSDDEDTEDDEEEDNEGKPSKYFKHADSQNEESEDEEATEKAKALSKEEQEREKRREQRRLLWLEDSKKEKRKVKSHKEKRFSEMKDLIEEINANIPANEWILIVENFQALNKIVEKIEKMGIPTPKRYIVFAHEFRNTVLKCIKAKIKLAPTQRKAQGSLRNKTRHIIEHYETLIQEYLKNPENYINDEDFIEDEQEEDEQEEKEDENNSKETRNIWERNDDDSSSDDDSDYNSDFDLDDLDGDKPMKLKKKTNRKGTGKGYKKSRKKKVIEQKKIEWNDQMVQKKLHELIEKRGRGSNYFAEIVDLQSRAKTDDVKILAYMTNIAFCVDQATKSNSYMSIQIWTQCSELLEMAISTAEKNPNTQYLKYIEGIDLFPGKDKVVIPGTFSSNIIHLHNEFIKYLQFVDPHTKEFVDRLLDVYQFLNLAERVFSYYNDRKMNIERVEIALTILNHLYHRESYIHKGMSKKQASLNKNADKYKSKLFVAEIEEQVTILCNLIFKYGNEEQIKRAQLMQVYNIALNNNYYKAKDLLLRCKKFTTEVDKESIQIQILFNRSIAQIGIASFKAGLFEECNDWLFDICGTSQASKIKEYLAQSLSGSRYQYNQDKNKKQEQEVLERNRLVPFHMHINQEMLEAVYLISAMVLEIPYQAQRTFDHYKKKPISKSLRRYMDNFSRKVGPPENTREHIFAAANFLKKGEWKSACEMLAKLELWNLFKSDLSQEVQAKLETYVKVTALKVFLFRYSKFYQNIGLSNLSTIFELPESKIESVIGKLILKSQLYATIEEPTKSIATNKRVEPSEMQEQCLKLAERIQWISEYSERIYDMRVGNSYLKNKRKKY